MREEKQSSARGVLWERDFAESPYIVIWEVTRACQLHCMHCRAEAQRHRNPLEMSTDEGFELIGQIAKMDKPLLVFTGGDPLERPDLFDFIRYAKAQGLEVAMTPSATPRVTKEALYEAREAGLTRCAFSLDGSTAQIHDKFRGTKGSYDLTIQALENLRSLDMPIQLNTTISRYNVDDLENIADIAEQYGTVLWSLFFLVPTGRGREVDMVDADTAERIMEWLYQQAKTRSFGVKTTEAPHYRRVVMQHLQDGKPAQGALLNENRNPMFGKHGRDEVAPGAVQSGFLIGQDALRSSRGVGDGNGFVFISHVGDVYPSGFLPVKAGNIRSQELAQIYRDSPAFRSLRDANQLRGKCGVCEFRHVCGGSRSRAYAMTGDYLASDPLCAYLPRSLEA